MYLSLICNLFDNSIVTYKTATQQTVNLILDTFRRRKIVSLRSCNSTATQKFQYTLCGYSSLTQFCGITHSMSRKGYQYNHAMADNFFTALKWSVFTDSSQRHLQKADGLIDRYIYFYRHEHIQKKAGVTPLTLRHSI